MSKHPSLPLFAAAFLVTSLAAAEPLPATAKKVTIDEFKVFADGKTVDVVIFDLGVPVTATLKWDWKKKRITGDALVNGKDKIKVKSKLSFEGDKACAENDGKPTCHLIYVDGEKFYEVRDDGDVHAVSTLKK
jgi:hypothetical protein